MPSIPLSSPDITDVEISAVVETLKSPTLSIGPRVEEFEAACAKVASRRFGVAVNSGTSGLHLAMLAAGIKPGDEVITTPFSFVASANCILFVGAKPVFVDIDPKTYNLDVSRLRKAITPRTRAVVAVETFGHPGGMLQQEAIAKEHDLALIEDCCEGFGGASTTAGGERQIGSYGVGGVFAFYPNKQITTGEGGMIVTDDPDFARLCRSYRNQGRDGMSWLAHQRLGYNYRLSEISAALGLAQVSRLDEILANRRHVAHLYMQRLIANPHLILPTLDDETHMSWFVFVVRLSSEFSPGDRDVVMSHLRDEGIGCNNYFPPIHLQPYMKQQFGFREGDFPVTESLSSRTLALPFFTRMTEDQVDRVVKILEHTLKKVLSKGSER